MCQLCGSVTTVYQCFISAALLSMPLLKMFHQGSASAQNISEYASDTIARTMMSQKSKPLVSFHYQTPLLLGFRTANALIYAGSVSKGLGNRYSQHAMLILALHRDLPLPLHLYL